MGNALAAKYDSVASGWSDKMRALGYYDGYLGFLTAPGARPDPAASRARRVIDVGTGTAAFAEAWVAVNGAPDDLHLIDISPAMLARAQTILARRHVEAQLTAGALGDDLGLEPADEVLAAHLIEHIPDPLAALRHLRSLLAPGGRLRLVVSKPHWCNVIIWFQWRHRTFTSAAMRALLAEAELELELEYAFPSGPPSRTSRGFIARRP